MSGNFFLPLTSPTKDNNFLQVFNFRKNLKKSNFPIPISGSFFFLSPTKNNSVIPIFLWNK